MAPNPATGVLLRKGTFGYRHTHTERHRVKTEAELRVMLLQTKDAEDGQQRQKLEEAGRILPWRLQREQGPACQSLDFGLPVSRT